MSRGGADSAPPPGSFRVKGISGLKWNPHKDFLFFSQLHVIYFHISCSFLDILGGNVKDYGILLPFNSASYAHICLICVPRTV